MIEPVLGAPAARSFFTALVIDGADPGAHRAWELEERGITCGEATLLGADNVFTAVGSGSSTSWSGQ